MEMPEAETSERASERTKRKMKVVWMVEDVPASANREARSYWTRVGAAFENRDGSFSIELAALPLTGRLQLREPSVGPKDGERREAA